MVNNFGNVHLRINIVALVYFFIIHIFHFLLFISMTKIISVIQSMDKSCSQYKTTGIVNCYLQEKYKTKKKKKMEKML